MKIECPYYCKAICPTTRDTPQESMREKDKTYRDLCGKMDYALICETYEDIRVRIARLKASE